MNRHPGVSSTAISGTIDSSLVDEVHQFVGYHLRWRPAERAGNAARNSRGVEARSRVQSVAMAPITSLPCSVPAIFPDSLFGGADLLHDSLCAGWKVSV
jgi:hypothetical protein